MNPRLADGDNKPTNPKLWEKCQDVAKSRYTKWPSAYAVGHALKLYKDEGGGWKKTASAVRVASRYLFAKGKAKKDVGHGGLDEWFSGHGQGKGKAPGEAQWGDWVAISPVKRTITREDGTKKTYEPGDIIGPCGDLTDDPNWKDLTRGGKTPFKCMARPKAHDMAKGERAEKAREKMRVQEKAPKGKKPVFTPTFKDDGD